MHVKPAEGREVRDPVTQHDLPPEGREVPSDTFWLRRLRDGDVEVVEPPQPEELVEKPVPARPAGKSNTVAAGTVAKG